MSSGVLRVAPARVSSGVRGVNPCSASDSSKGKQRNPVFFTWWSVFIELQEFNISEAAVNVTEIGHYRV